MLRPEMGWPSQLPPASDAFTGTHADLVPGSPFRLPVAPGSKITAPDQRCSLEPADLRRHLAGSPFEAGDWAGDDTLALRRMAARRSR